MRVYYAHNDQSACAITLVRREKICFDASILISVKTVTKNLLTKRILSSHTKQTAITKNS